MASSRANVRAIAAQDTFYVGNMKGVGRAHLHRHLCQGRLHPSSMIKRPSAAADLVNDRVVPFYDARR